MQVEIYGHSDDCIEVEGDGLTDEFSAYNHRKFLHFDDGTIVEAEYGPEGEPDYRWWIKVLKLGRGTKANRVDGTYHGEDDGTAKCDRIVLTGNITAVRCYRTAEGPNQEDMEEFFESFDFRDLSVDQAKRIMDICGEKK